MEPVNTTVFNHQQPGKIGVLVTNLGTPTAATASALRPYLKQFLSDPRVIDIAFVIICPAIGKRN